MGASKKSAVPQDAELAGMPAPLKLYAEAVGNEVVVCYGGRVLSCYSQDDRGLRNLAIVALTRAGIPGVEVAALFGVRPEHVSRLRRMADEGGSAGLVPAMGRPVKLDRSGRRRAYAMADEGHSGAEIAAALGVSASTISRCLGRRPRPQPPELDLDGVGDTASDDAETDSGDAQPETGDAETDSGEDEGDAAEDSDKGDDESGQGAVVPRIAEGSQPSAYAGAMLLHGFMDQAGAGAVLTSLPSGVARHYDAAGLMLSATFGFALGSSSAEGTKHLLAADAGAVVGLERFPHLRTLRPRLGALAEATDPIGVQVALAKAMVEADPEAPEVFFVDDHFVAYAGGAPVAKGWNTRRRHAEAGRDDTLIVDDAWRAICFSSGPPSGLSKTMLGPLDQLRAIVGDRRVMIGFDRGGAYPKAFAELGRRGYDWVTYRRAPLATPTVSPTRSWVNLGGRRRYMTVADETVTLKEVGAVRQISVYEGGRVVLQILTSDTTTPAAALAARLRDRWCIENCFKYLEDHHGIHWLCDYQMDLAPDTTKVANPARTAAKANLTAAKETLAGLESALATAATSPGDDLDATNATLARLSARIEVARTGLEAARTALKDIPAKVPADSLDPEATRATPRTNRRAMQMVCRLLAYNAELDLARAFNAYLADPDEYRAITRHLLHQPGTVAYSPAAIAVSIRAPDAPRVARALQGVVGQLNANPPHLTGDGRPITYRIEPKP